MNSKKNLVIVAVLALLVGYALGDVFGLPEADKEQLKGDVSKAETVEVPDMKSDPELTAFQQKLQSNSEYYLLTKEYVTVLEKRASDLSTLTSRTVALFSEVPELDAAIQPILSLEAKAYNAKVVLKNSRAGLEKFAKGETAPDYTQASNNAYVGYSKVEGSLQTGRKFVEAATSYLNGKKGKEFEEMRQNVVKWVNFCAEDAVFCQSEEYLSFWLECIDNMKGEMAKTLKNDGKSVLALKKTYEGLKAEKKDVKELFADNAIFWKDIKANFSSNDLLWSKAEPNVEGFLNMALPLSGTTSQTN